MTVSGRPPVGEDPAAAGSAQDAGATDARRADRAAAARRLDEVFGRPTVASSDEIDPAGSDGLGEDWYRANRPPHHGG